MPDPAKPKTYWWVVCQAYAKGPAATPDQAQRDLEAIQRLGACTFPHEIRPGSKDGPRVSGLSPQQEVPHA